MARADGKLALRAFHRGRIDIDQIRSSPSNPATIHYRYSWLEISCPRPPVQNTRFASGSAGRPIVGESIRSESTVAATSLRQIDPLDEPSTPDWYSPRQLPPFRNFRLVVIDDNMVGSANDRLFGRTAKGRAAHCGLVHGSGGTGLIAPGP